MLVDRKEEDVPYVAVNDLSALRQQWPDFVISGMTNRQLELEELHRMCKKKYCGAPTGSSIGQNNNIKNLSVLFPNSNPCKLWDFSGCKCCLTRPSL